MDGTTLTALVASAQSFNEKEVISYTESKLYGKMVTALMAHVNRHPSFLPAVYASTKSSSKSTVISDAEKILSKTGAGMSLYERLERDPLLRQEFMEILAELANVPERVQQLNPTQGEKLVNVPVDQQMSGYSDL